MNLLFSCRKEKGSLDSQNGITELIKQDVVIPDNIILPDSLEAYYARKDSMGIFSWKEYESKKKIVTYINGSCFNCIEDLMKWEGLISKYESTDLFFVFYVYMDPEEFDEIRRYTQKAGLSAIILIDEKNEFALKNNISAENKLLQSIMLDGVNNTVIFGNPLYSDKLLELYIANLES